MNLLPGLHEALRLMALNDLDFAPGTIMKRIEQLEIEVDTENVNSAVDFSDPCSIGREWFKDSRLEKWFPISAQELETLKSTLAQRDEQLRVAKYDLNESRNIVGILRGTNCTISEQLTTAQKERDVALNEVRQWKESTEAVALASKEVENKLKVALGECVVELRKCQNYIKGNDNRWIELAPLNSAITQAQVLLERSK